MICPFYKNNKVKEQFNEIVKSLGGRPLTDEEFQSSDLRNQRQGIDYSSMESAYKIWHRNNGNPIDIAPNGKSSILFQTLLNHFGGDRAKAIVAKSKIYSDEFFNWFGDWTVTQTEDIPYQLISHLRRSNINVYGKYRMQQYLHKYSDKLVQLFIGKKNRELFKKRLIKARPDLDSTFILDGISFIHEPFYNQHIIAPSNPALHNNRLLGKRIIADFKNKGFFITTFTNVALPDDIQQMIKDGLLKKSSIQEGYYDLTENGIKRANISQDVFTIFDLIEKGLAEYKSGDIYLTDKGKSEGRAQYTEIDSILDFLHSLEDNKENSVYISTAIRWIINKSITLPEDHEKAYQAFALARKKHLDLQKYNTLGELITAPEMQPKEKKVFNPDKAKTFHNRRTVTTEGGRVFTVYDVENTERGQKDVCNAIAAHYEMSPWCLSTFTTTGEPTASAKRYWDHYNSIPRKIAYENGKPVAFSSSDSLATNTFHGLLISKDGYIGTLYTPETIPEIDTWIQQGLVIREPNHFKGYPDRLKLTELGNKEVSIQTEAWWDMEDRFPQNALSDSIVSEQKSMFRGNNNVEMEDYEGFIPHDIFDNPYLMFYNDIHNAIISIVADYITSIIRTENLVPNGWDETWTRNMIRDAYLSEGELDDMINYAFNNDINGTSNEIAQTLLGRNNILDNIRNGIRDTIQNLTQQLPGARVPGEPIVPVAPPAPAPPIYYNDLLQFFMTPNGEVYGFITSNNDMYLDEEIISPQHPIHEYTHIWDRIVAKNNPELWKRGVELMKQIPEWNEILNDENYGKRWSEDESISKSQLEFLIASEVHSRLVGENGEQIIDNISKEKGSKDIVNKLKQWILDFWKSLKSTFSNFSDEELQKLTLEDFNMMTVRDFVELSNEDNISKVVDDNGEPLVVYHHTNNPNLNKFSTDFENYFAKDGGTKEAIFFDEEKTGTLNRKYDLPVFLNIKELNEYNETKQQLHDRGTTYREVVNNSAKNNNKTGGVHMKDFDDNKKEHQSVWIIHNSNQVKSATDNNGTFSYENDDIRDSWSDISNTVFSKKEYVAPKTEILDITSSDEILSNITQPELTYQLEDDNNQNQSRVEQMREYLDEISDNLLQAFDTLKRYYSKAGKTDTKYASESNRQVKELIGKLHDIRGVQALEEAIEWGLINLGTINKDGRYIHTDENTILGFLYNEYNTTDGKFTNVTPDQLFEIYKAGIGFYENILIPLLPEYSNLVFDDELLFKLESLKKSVVQAKELWSKAVQIVGKRIINGAIQSEVVASQEIKDNMKDVAYNWLTMNTYYNDISTFQLWTGNFGQMENPVIRIAFHLIQMADTNTNAKIHPIAAKLAKEYRKADFSPKRWFESNWQKAFMELDRNGIPTGRFVTDINRGQYEVDLDEFVTDLNEKWDKKYGFHYAIDQYGYTVRTDTYERIENQKYSDNSGTPNYYKYQLEIEKWKSNRANKQYTFEYYKERMSKPYRGHTDPYLSARASDLDGHGLSPRTLLKYQRIMRSINEILENAKDETTGIAHPENLKEEEKLKLDLLYDELDDMQNPYNADGSVKDEEEKTIAFELRAWQKWIGEKIESEIDMDLFEKEAKKVEKLAKEKQNPRLLEDFYRYNTRVGINPNYIAQTIGRFKEDKMEDVDIVHSRLILSSIQSLVKSKTEYTRELGLLEAYPMVFKEYKMRDQMVEDGKSKGSKELAEIFKETFYYSDILYKDEHGNYRKKDGTVVTDPETKDDLLTYHEYFVEYYTNIAKQYNTIPGLFDDNGQPVVISGTDQQIHDYVYDMLTYTKRSKNEDGDIVEEKVPLTIFKMLMPAVDSFINEKTGNIEPTMGNIPRGNFAIKNDLSGIYINENYDKKDNHSEQPIRQIYDNSESLRKIEEDGLKPLYDELIKVMKSSYDSHSARLQKFDYLLPKMNANDAAIASRIMQKGFSGVAKDIWSSMTEVQPNDVGMQQSSDLLKDPDGTSGTSIPLRYTGRLEDRSTYTTDIVGAVIMYAHMAQSYLDKSEIESQLNILQYNLSDDVRKSANTNQYKSSENSERAFRSMMSSGIYDNSWDVGKNYEQNEESVFGTAVKNILATGGTFGLLGASISIPVAVMTGTPIPILTGAAISGGVGLAIGTISQLSGKISQNKLARMFQRTESLQMLGFNVLSMLVGMGDAVFKMTRDAIACKYATIRDLFTGIVYFIYNMPNVISNTGNPLANCKLVAMMQMNGVSKDPYRIYKNMNYGRTRKIINNICLGGFSLLDYGSNCILLKSYYNNIRYYKGNAAGVPAGWYSRYELQHEFSERGLSFMDFNIAYESCTHTLWSAYEYNSDGGYVEIKPEFDDPNNPKYVPLKIRTRVRTKTIQRGALYNGMNPDNDIPLYKRSIYGSMIGAMRGWLTQQIQHLFYGLDDVSIRNQRVNQEKRMRFGVEQIRDKISPNIPRTAKQRAQRMTWNYETGLPQSEVFNGLYRSFYTLLRKLMAAIKIDRQALKDTKLSYVEKYAWRDAIITLSMVAMFALGWPKVHNWAKNVNAPKNRIEAGATGPIDAVTRYVPQQFIGNETYKLFLDDVYFRIFESQLTGFDPKTTFEIVNALSVYKNATEEHLGFVQAIGDAYGFTGHSSDEIIKTGSYKYYTRAEKRLYKTWSLGQLDNLHTAFTYNGLRQNLNFYYHQYGWIYKAFGYDDFSPEQKKTIIKKKSKSKNKNKKRKPQRRKTRK